MGRELNNRDWHRMYSECGADYTAARLWLSISAAESGNESADELAKALSEIIAAERARIISALREPSNGLVELVDTAYRGDGWDGSFRRAISAVAAWLENSHAKAT